MKKGRGDPISIQAKGIEANFSTENSRRRIRPPVAVTKTWLKPGGPGRKENAMKLRLDAIIRNVNGITTRFPRIETGVSVLK